MNDITVPAAPAITLEIGNTRVTVPAIELPGGWGWPSGYVVGGSDPAAALPELPMLRLLPCHERNSAVVAALSQLPEPVLMQIRQRDVVRTYGLPKATANDVIARARLATPTRHGD